MVCVFCGTDEGEKIIRKDDIKWYVCGSCSQKLMGLPYEKIKKAYDLAVEKGLETKATALKSFMCTEEDIKEREANNRKVNSRKRAVRTVRSKKRKPWEPKEK